MSVVLAQFFVVHRADGLDQGVRRSYEHGAVLSRGNDLLGRRSHKSCQGELLLSLALYALADSLRTTDGEAELRHALREGGRCSPRASNLALNSATN